MQRQAFDHLKKFAKKRINQMFVFRKRNSSVYVIGMLTNGMQYIEYEMVFKQSAITMTVASKLRSLFNDYEFARNSDVVVLDTIDEKCALYLYLMFMHQQVQFNLRSISMDSVVRRIATYHQNYVNGKKASKVSKSYLNKVWAKLVKHKRCPWIDEKIDAALKRIRPSKAYAIKATRTGMYYILVKEHLMNLYNAKNDAQRCH